MVDRQIIYVGQIPQDTDLLLTNKNAMVALGYLMQATLGTGTLVDGLACTPTGPATMTVNVAGGSIYALDEIDSTAYGSIAPDTTDQIVKQGIVIPTQNFACPAPVTSGQSVVYLVEAAYQDVDTGSTVLPYYNASNPSVAYSGPNNTGVSQNTIRQGLCKVQVKTGVAATTGTQVTPSPDAGFTGLFAVTVANSQSTITSGNIVQLATAPFIGTKLPGVIGAVQAGAMSYALDTSGAANTITVTLSPIPSTLADGMPVRVKVANSSTAATVMNVNGLGNVACTTTSGAAFTTNTVVANGIYEFTYDANGTRFQLQGFTAATATGLLPANNLSDVTSPSTALANIGGNWFSTGDVKLTLKDAADTGWVMCDDGTLGNASSSGTTRANADTSALFTLLWNKVSNTYAPVSGGRGGSAAADFAANKTIQLTAMMGRAIAIAGSGSGLTVRTLGETLGEETHTPTLAEMFAHTHAATVTDPTHDHVASAYKEVVGGSGSSVDRVNSDGDAYAGAGTPNPTTGSSATGITVANASEGSSTAFNVMQPTSFLNAMIKL